MADGVNAIANLSGRVNANGALLVSLDGGSVLLAPRTYGELPTPFPGLVAVITDSDTQVWGEKIGSGGSFTVLAFYNGSDWTVAGI